MERDDVAHGFVLWRPNQPFGPTLSRVNVVDYAECKRRLKHSLDQIAPRVAMFLRELVPLTSCSSFPMGHEIESGAASRVGDGRGQAILHDSKTRNELRGLRPEADGAAARSPVSIARE